MSLENLRIQIILVILLNDTTVSFSSAINLILNLFKKTNKMKKKFILFIPFFFKVH